MSVQIGIFFIFLWLCDESGNICCLSSPKQFGALGKQVQVSVIDNFPDSISFFNQYVLPQVPLLIKHGATQSPAYEIWKSDESLLGDDDKVQDAKNWIVTVETQKKEDRKVPPVVMPFYDFLQTYKDSDQYLVEELPGYLARNAAMPYPLQCAELAEAFLDAHVWFSSGGTKSVIHTDDADNILCVIDGQKELIIVDPHKYSKQVLMDVTDGSYSSIDVDNVDLDKFPDLDKVEYIHANMSSGDCLFIPYRWIHQVRSYNRNVAINIWWNHHHNRYLDLDNCDNLYDPALTLDKFKFKGFDSQLEHIEAVKELVEDLLSDRIVTSADQVFDFILGGVAADLSAAQVENGHVYCEKLFVLMDPDNDGEVKVEDLEMLPTDSWNRIQGILAVIEEMVDKVPDDGGDEEEDSLSHENIKSEL